MSAKSIAKPDRSAVKCGRWWHSRWVRRVFRVCRILVILAVLGFLGLMGLLWLEHRTGLTLPTPTGPFAVGRVVLDWADDAKVDKLAPTPGTKRELLIWIWYPAASAESFQEGNYVPAELPAEGTPSR